MVVRGVGEVGQQKGAARSRRVKKKLMMLFTWRQRNQRQN